MTLVDSADQSNLKAAWTADDLRADPHQAADKARRVRSMFTSIAKRYDFNNRLHSMWRDQAWRRAVVRMAGIGPKDDVLDMACGTGDLTEMLARSGPRSILGMDFTEAMLEIATQKSGRVGSRDGRTTPVYRLGDAMDIDLPDGSLDVLTIAFGIRNVSEPVDAVGEFARVLRPGGRLLVLEFSTPARWLPRVANAIYSRHIMPVTATLLSGDRSRAYHYLPRSVATFADPARLAAMITSRGFAVQQQVPMTMGICTITLATRV
jgi:demethylmenaquinone methyltransferase/2-methoxy-6-polyprenyl-1,4-benzoquinol methylase